MTKEEVLKYNKDRIANAKNAHYIALMADHKAAMLIRKLDASASRIKDFNQKNPKDAKLVPKTSIHKVLV